MNNRVLWFIFGDVTYWSFAVDDEETLAGTLWSGANTEMALENFEAWLETFLEINKPHMIGLGMDRQLEKHRKINCEACFAVTELQADKHGIQTFNVDLSPNTPAPIKSVRRPPKSFGSPN